MATTIPGGRYERSDGVIVDAHGNALAEKGRESTPDPAPTPAKPTSPPKARKSK